MYQLGLNDQTELLSLKLLLYNYDIRIYAGLPLFSQEYVVNKYTFVSYR